MKIIFTARRVTNTLIILYFIGALLHWFVFNQSERKWKICEDEGLVLVFIFFYLCYILYYFSPYLTKITILCVSVYNLIVKLLGPL